MRIGNQCSRIKQGRAGAIFQLLLAMVLAGSSVVVGKTLALSMPVFLATFCTLLVAFVTMLPLLWKRRREIRRLDSRQWGNLFLQGLCGIVLFRVFILYGLRQTGALQAGIITGTAPAILTFLAALLLGERPSPTALSGVACAVGGAISLNLHGAQGGEQSLVGSLLVTGAVVSEAVFSILRKKVASAISATANTGALIFCSLVILAPPALAEAAAMRTLPETGQVLTILYYGVFATVLAYLLWTGAVGKVDGATAGVATAAMPVSAVALAVLFLGEEMGPSQFFGCALVVLGIMLSAWTSFPKKPPVSPAG